MFLASSLGPCLRAPRAGPYLVCRWVGAAGATVSTAGGSPSARATPTAPGAARSSRRATGPGTGSVTVYRCVDDGARGLNPPRADKSPSGRRSEGPAPPRLNQRLAQTRVDLWASVAAVSRSRVCRHRATPQRGEQTRCARQPVRGRAADLAQPADWRRTYVTGYDFGREARGRLSLGPARALEAGLEFDHGCRLCHARESPERDAEGIIVPSEVNPLRRDQVAAPDAPG